MDACNAYVIFAHPHPDRPTNVAPVMNPFEAATAVLAANGSTFMSRTIRVDRLRLPSAIALETATNALSKRDAWLPSNADPKKSLFVGGLDYAAKEEDVRVLFEELVKSERGPSTEKYVTGVRIVRDAATQLGKGFGYINFKVSVIVPTSSFTQYHLLGQRGPTIGFLFRLLHHLHLFLLMYTACQSRLLFVLAGEYHTVDNCAFQRVLDADQQDRESVEELLAMDEKKFRFAKRPLRVQPCKTLPLGARSTPAESAAQKTRTLPKGHPKLGDAIKDLSKEERKMYKATDADRQARRMAKKKSKAAFDQDRNTGAVKLDTGRSKDKHVKPKAKKSKARSAHAVSQMKGSRA
jgi:nucleolar protein 12